MARGFSGANRFSIVGQPEFQADTSNARQEQADPVSLREVRGPSTRHAAQPEVLQVPADRARPADVLALVLVPDSVARGLAALAVRGRVLVRFRPQAKLRGRSVRQDARAVATSSIRRPRKAR